MYTTNEVDRILNIPPIHAQGPDLKMTKRYKFVSSKQIVDVLGSLGWTPRQAFFTKAKRSSDPLHKRHCIRFQNEQYGSNVDDGLGGLRPEIVMNNSHDGTCSLNLSGGLFRLVCSNGLTIKEADFGELTIRHDNKELRQMGSFYLNYVCKAFATDVPEAISSAQGWKDIRPEYVDRMSFYKKAGELRNLNMYDYRYKQFDVAQRREDFSHDLWTMFNRTQEYLIRGGIKNHFDHNEDAKINHRILKPLTDIKRIENINKELWALARETAEILV